MGAAAGADATAVLEAGAGAPADGDEEAGAADADAAVAGFLAPFAAVCANTAGGPNDAPIPNGATTSIGTTTAAQTALCQRILDPFFPLFPAQAKEISALSFSRTLTRSSVFGPPAGVQRLDVRTRWIFRPDRIDRR
jgi:hypothetical protein